MARNIQINRAILKTLCYADIFDYPLSPKEIHRFLIYKQRVSQPSVFKALESLQKDQKIAKKNNFFFFKGKVSLVAKRQARTSFSNKKIKIAKKVANWLKIIPSVKMIAVTGALAVKNTSNQDDIDLMIITSKNRLWLSRLLVVVLVSLVAKRRKPSTLNPQPSTLANSICLNLFLDESSLQIPKPKQNFYTAHEVIQILPLVNKDSTYQQFLSKNSWVNKFLPNFKIPRAAKPSTLNPQSSILNFLEIFVFKSQFIYMRKKITNEQVSLNYAFFHPRNTKDLVREKYQANLKKYTLKI